MALHVHCFMTKRTSQMILSDFSAAFVRTRQLPSEFLAPSLRLLAAAFWCCQAQCDCSLLLIQSIGSLNGILGLQNVRGFCRLVCLKNDIGHVDKKKLVDALIFKEFMGICLREGIMAFKWLTHRGNMMH